MGCSSSRQGNPEILAGILRCAQWRRGALSRGGSECAVAQAIIRDLTPAQIGRSFRSMTFKQLEKRFPTEEACLDYLVSMRWKNGVVCPRCENTKVYKLAKPYRWQCKKCAPNGYRFSPIAGTIFENTNIKLRMWFHAILLMVHSK